MNIIPNIFSWQILADTAIWRDVCYVKAVANSNVYFSWCRGSVSYESRISLCLTETYSSHVAGMWRWGVTVAFVRLCYKSYLACRHRLSGVGLLWHNTRPLVLLLFPFSFIHPFNVFSQIFCLCSQVARSVSDTPHSLLQQLWRHIALCQTPKQLAVFVMF
jgi:hypothetical protein